MWFCIVRDFVFMSFVMNLSNICSFVEDRYRFAIYYKSIKTITKNGISVLHKPFWDSKAYRKCGVLTLKLYIFHLNVLNLFQIHYCVRIFIIRIIMPITFKDNTFMAFIDLKTCYQKQQQCLFIKAS